MSKMRIILKKLMDAAGDNANDIEKRVGVPRNTTGRFLRGMIGEPRSSTVQKWASVYNVTESQLRGDVEIEGMGKPREELRNILTLEEYKHFVNIKKMSDDKRDILYRLSSVLAESVHSASSLECVTERRSEVKSPNNQLRAGETFYQSPPRKKRMRVNIDAKKQTGT